jgi:hypothetical protein
MPDAVEPPRHLSAEGTGGGRARPSGTSLNKSGDPCEQ